jgi:hypothetical protein
MSPPSTAASAGSTACGQYSRDKDELMTTTLEHDQTRGSGRTPHALSERFTVRVSYNGTTKTIEANPQAAVQATLQHAISAFGITQNVHLLSLFTEGNVELKDNLSFEDQSVQPGTLLLLRPSAVKGGAP